jgi:hypothetical protein
MAEYRQAGFLGQGSKTEYGGFGLHNSIMLELSKLTTTRSQLGSAQKE